MKAIATVHAHWGEAYGVSPAFWGGDQVVVAPREGEEDYHALFVFVHGEAAVVQAPPALRALAEGLIQGASPQALLRPEFWRTRLGERIERFVGPAWLGYADAGGEGEAPGTAAEVRAAAKAKAPAAFGKAARRLGEADGPALAALEAAVGPRAWAHSGIEPGEVGQAIYGLFEGQVLAAAGMVEVWGDRLGHIGIVAHPAHQGRGMAQAVVAEAMREGFARGLVMQYRTLADNAPSMAIARRLGFGHHATTLAVRLRPA